MQSSLTNTVSQRTAHAGNDSVEPRTRARVQVSSAGFSSLMDLLARREDENAPSARARRMASDASREEELREAKLREDERRAREARSRRIADLSGALAAANTATALEPVRPEHRPSPGQSEGRSNLPHAERAPASDAERSDSISSHTRDSKQAEGKQAEGEKPPAKPPAAREQQSAREQTTTSKDEASAKAARAGVSTQETSTKSDAAGKPQPTDSVKPEKVEKADANKLSEAGKADVAGKEGQGAKEPVARVAASEAIRAASQPSKSHSIQADHARPGEPRNADASGSHAKPTATAQSAGISSAQMTAQMKNTPEQNAFAGLTGKFLPEAAALTPTELETEKQAGMADSRVTVIPSRGEWNLAGMRYSESAGALNDAPPPAGQLMLERLNQLSHLMVREVQSLRQTTAKELDVVLRPDAQTEISLHVRWHDGQLLAEARCHRGDFIALHDGWSQLQETLMRHGVRLAELNPPQSNGQTSGFQFSKSNQQNPGDSAQRESIFGKPGRISTGKIKRRVPTPPPALAHGSKHLLESWA